MEDQNKKQTIRKRKKVKIKKKKQNTLWKRVVSIVAILVFIVASCMGAYRIYQSKIINNRIGVTSYAVEKNVQKVETKRLVQESLDKPIYILLLGIEQLKNNEIQSAFLVSINEETKQLDIIGIPVDSKILSRDGKNIDKFGDMYQIGGLELTRAVVEDIFHIQIPYYIVYNENSFQRVIDVMGLNKFYIENSFTQYDENGKDISLVQGYQPMDATKAWSYMTYENNADSGIEQMQRQERLMKDSINHQFDHNRFIRAFDVWRYWDHLDTNISTFDAMKFTVTSKIPEENYYFYILPGAKMEVNKKIYWDINPIDTQRLVGVTMGYEGGSNDK